MYGKKRKKRRIRKEEKRERTKDLKRYRGKDNKDHDSSYIMLQESGIDSK